MRSLFRKCILILSLSLVFCSSGCKKGDDGAPGKDGNANVVSRIYSIESWSNNSSIWYADIPILELNSLNINTTSVQVYWGKGDNVWNALPYTYVSSGGNYFMGYSTAPNLVQVKWIYNLAGLGTDPNTKLNTTVQIKVVLIPPAS